MPHQGTEHVRTKKQIEFHKILRQKPGQSQVWPDKRKSTIRSEDSRAGSSVVLVQKIKPTTNKLSERMNKIKFLSRGPSLLKSDVEQAASFENFNQDSSIEKKGKQPIK